MDIEVGDFIYTVEDVKVEGGYPAKLNGLPENCYEGEDPEITYDVTAINICRGACGAGDIEGLIKDWSELDELVLEAYEKECAP